MSKIDEIKELLHDRRLINGRRDYELDNELAESIDCLLSRLEIAEKALEEIYNVESLCERDSLLHALTEINHTAEKALQQLRQ